MPILHASGWEPGRFWDGGEESAVAAGGSEIILPLATRKAYWIYILASRSRNLYTGVTSNLSRRMTEHRQRLIRGFTSKYKIFRLVHYEAFADIAAAIEREKEIKAWRREKKVWLIEKHNPLWRDLAQIVRIGPSARNTEKADPSPPSKVRPGSG
jgi:putative endonuclease